MEYRETQKMTPDEIRVIKKAKKEFKTIANKFYKVPSQVSQLISSCDKLLAEQKEIL